jgi:hypothetical protein
MKNNELQIIKQDSELKNSKSSLMVEAKNELDNEISVAENYIPSAFDAQIDEYDSMIYFEDLYSENTFTADDLSFELHFELELQIKQITASQLCPDENTKDKVRLLKARQKILEDLHSYLTSRELCILDYSISTYASVCDSPWERRKEIRRAIYTDKKWFEANYINCERYSDKIDKIDLNVLFELTEIILSSEVIRYCAWDPEKSLHYPFLDKLSSISKTPQYGSFDIDAINEDDFYKEQYEYVFFSDLQFEDANGYQYYYDEIDLGEMENVEIYQIEIWDETVEYLDEDERAYFPTTKNNRVDFINMVSPSSNESII